MLEQAVLTFDASRDTTADKGSNKPGEIYQRRVTIGVTAKDCATDYSTGPWEAQSTFWALGGYH